MSPVRGTMLSRNLTFLLLQALAHAVDVGGGEGDMVEAAGVLVFLLGAAHHDAVARLARAHQVHGGDAAGIEPVAREVERRAVAVLQAQHVAIEILGASPDRRARWCNAAVRRAAWIFSLDEGEVGVGAHHPGADGFKMAEPALQLLGHGVDVAEAALQRMVLEDRGGAGGIVGEVDRLACLVDGMGGRPCGW